MQGARLSILLAEQENGYLDVASILGPANALGKISQCACAFLDESPSWVLRKSLFYALQHLRGALVHSTSV